MSAPMSPPPCLTVSSLFLLLLLLLLADGTAATRWPDAARLLNRARKAREATEFLQAHNAAREASGMPPLHWDGTLTRYASQWARQRRGDCKMIHSGGPFGENIFWSQLLTSWTPAKIVGQWVEERLSYDPKSNSCAEGEMCGHYTQIVWRTTTAVGCARVKCDNDAGYFVVCEYSPRGNYEGESPFDVVTGSGSNDGDATTTG